MAWATAIRGVSPFGPIFGKELRVTARLKRTYWLRALYLLVLLVVLLLAWTASAMNPSAGVAVRNQQLSQLGNIFFIAVSIFLVMTMGLIGPLLTATAISSERLHKTLAVLLMTPLSAWQIVAGKLFSRLLVAITLIGLTLPVFALVRLLGGVELWQMAEMIALALVAALSSAAIGIFFSTLLNRAYAIMLLSFATMGLLYLFVPFCTSIYLSAGGRQSPSAHATSLSVLLSINPYMSAVFVAEGAMATLGMQVWWQGCLITQPLLAAALLIFSSLIIRRRAARQTDAHGGEAVAPAPPAPGPHDPLPARALLASVAREENDDGQSSAAAAISDIPPPLAAAPLSYAGKTLRTPRRSAAVGENPILWHELRRSLFSRRWQRVAGALACAALLLWMYWLMARGRGNYLSDPSQQQGWAYVFNTIYCLIAVVLSSTAIAQEKESDTWTLIIAAPVSGHAMVWGKAAGVLRRMLGLFCIIAIHFLIFACAGVIRFSAALACLYTIFTFNCLWIATGVYFSLRIAKASLAVISNIMLVVATYVLTLTGLNMISGVLNSRNLSLLGEPRRLQLWEIDRAVEVCFALAAIWLIVSVLLTIFRRRGAIGNLLLSCLLFVVAAVVYFNGSPGGYPSDLPNAIAWYFPHFYFSEMPWGPTEYLQTLPQGEHVELSAWYAVLAAVGVAHLVAATGILLLTGTKFNALVARAGDKKRRSAGGPLATDA